MIVHPAGLRPAGLGPASLSFNLVAGRRTCLEGALVSNMLDVCFLSVIELEGAEAQYDRKETHKHVRPNNELR